MDKPPLPPFDRWPDSLKQLWPGKGTPTQKARLYDIIRMAYELGQDSVAGPAPQGLGPPAHGYYGEGKR